MHKNPLFLLFLFLAVSLSAQVTTDFAYKKHTWDTNPKIHTLTDKDKEGNYVILKDKIIIEFAYESSGQLVEYSTRHTIIHFNNETGIEEMNKIYVSSASILEEMELKGRTITSSGKVILLDKSSVKKVDNLQNSGAYLFFAMEGIDKGGETEYIYTNKKTANTNASWSIQTAAIHKDVSIDIYSPDNLIFEAKGYNGFPQFSTDTTIKDKNHIFSSIEFIPSLIEEKYATYDANKMRFDFQLTYNTAVGKARVNTWEYCGNIQYNNTFKLEKNELKAIDKTIAKLGLGNLKTDEAKIRALELYVKTNISVSGDNSLVDKILDLKYGDEFGLQRLYIGFSKALNIPFEAVLTTDRTSRKFDANFQSWNSLREYLLYYPGFDKYLSCSDYSSRLGFPPPQLTANKGLFIKETTLGDITAAIAKVKTIEAIPHTYSHNNITASVTFNAESFTPTVEFKQEFLGYSAFYVQPSIFYMNANQKTELLDNFSKFIGTESIVKSSKYSGAEKEDILVKPLVIESIIETPHLVENAGAKYIFKVGALIGPQEELYQEKIRQSDGEITYTHSFTRTLNIKIPTGYKVKNLEDIKIDKKYILGGKTLSVFTSSYTLAGDMLVINVYEDYQAIVYPKATYEEFRTVINAAADFNKIALILEKI